MQFDNADVVAAIEEFARALGARLQPESPWMRAPQAAAYCGIKPGQFSRIAPSIPRRRVGRTFLYHRDDLDAWIRSHDEGGDLS